MKSIRWMVKVFPVTVALIGLVALAFVAVARIQRSVEAQGEVHVERYQVVRPRVSGLVMDVRAEPGDAVREGQVLVQLQDYEFQRDLLSTRQALEETRSRLHKLRVERRLQLEALHPLEIEQQRAEISRSLLEEELAASRVAEARLELEAARERHHQAQELAEAGLISQRELQERRQQALAAEQRFVQAGIQERAAAMQEPSLQTELRLLSSEQRREVATLDAEIAELEGQVEEWTAQVAQLEALHKLHTLTAGMDGVIVGTPVSDLIGQYVQAGQDLLTIIDDASIQFVTFVPENALVQVRAGQPAQVEIAGLPKDQFQLFAGSVEKVLQAPETTPAEDLPLYPVQIRLENPWIPLDEGRFYLRGGMRGTAKIAYRGDVPILRALYEFLVGTPQLPEATATTRDDTREDDSLAREPRPDPASSSPARAQVTM